MSTPSHLHANRQESPPMGLLYNRKVLWAVALFCLIESVWSWVDIVKGTPHHEDLIIVPFVLCLGFIAVSITFRSSFWADRMVFGPIAGAFGLIAARAAPLSPAAMLVIDTADALMWSAAVTVSLIILGRGAASSRTRGTGGPD